MEQHIILGILVFACLTGSAETVDCVKLNDDNTQTKFSCNRNCCGSLREKQCCPAPQEPKPSKTLATDLIVVIVVVVTVFLIALVVFTVLCWCRQHGLYFCAKNDEEVPTNPTRQSIRADRSGHNTGISTGLGGQSAFPTRLHPTLVHGFGGPVNDGMSSMGPEFSSTDRGPASIYGGYFSAHGGASPI